MTVPEKLWYMNNSTSICLCEGIFIQQILIKNPLFASLRQSSDCSSMTLYSQNLEDEDEPMANKHRSFFL